MDKRVFGVFTGGNPELETQPREPAYLFLELVSVQFNEF